MYKKIFSCFLLFFLFFGMLAPGAAMAADTTELPTGSIALYIGSNKAYVNNTEKLIDPMNGSVVPIIQNSRTMLPVKFISENYGCTVQWDGANRKITVKSGENTVVLQIGNKTVYKNGIGFLSDVAPFIKDNRTYIPVKALSESIGKNVFYYSKLILISEPETTFNSAIDQTLIGEMLSKYTEQKLTIEQIAAFDKSTVMIYSLDSNKVPFSQGSGFYIGEGVIVTNYHVVKDARSIIIETENGSQYEIAGMVEWDQTLDLAMLKTKQKPDMITLKLGFNKTLVKGQQIVTISSPYGFKNTVSDGIISGFRKEGDVNLIQITAPITFGSSGSPLFNMYGQIIGINSSGMESGNLNFAISVNHLYNWYMSKVAGKTFYEISIKSA
ncbi:stalk domain-containing protein [Clostridium sp. BNL1100]|uniref:stalk domain-containing protein n=1 Tax=Clostridium sp. BNL1100 TaxID=755731 RepID=UPI00024A7283|nr:stalk domain-containing protein [Clostridium sp. BNL1100]AEY65924.1 trypsin-like serine protease with C-terminal PDZ domain [Clostridium sp. BNL1100]